MGIAEKNHPHHPVTSAPAFHYIFSIADVAREPAPGIADDRLDFPNRASVPGCEFKIPAVPAESRSHELNNTKSGGIIKIKIIRNSTLKA